MLLAGRFSLDNRLLLAVAFILAAGLAVFLGLDREAAGRLAGMGLVGALLAGAFYTLGMTTPLSMVVILEIMQLGNPIATAFCAAASAATVDCFLFWGARDAIVKSAGELARGARRRFRNMDAVAPVAGFFIFGLPLPDELALALIGISEIRVLRLWPVVFLAKLATLLIFWNALGRL